MTLMTAAQLTEATGFTGKFLKEKSSDLIKKSTSLLIDQIQIK
jgi:hypothetical protein